MRDDGLTVETVEQEGFTLRVRYDEYVDDNDNPRKRGDTQAATLMCEHRDYNLGDGTVQEILGRDDFKGTRDLLRYLSLVHGAICILPLYLYDHSGISISVGRNPYTFDSQGWDTSMVGYAFTTQAQLDVVGCPPDKVEELIRGEVEEYNAYLTGQVFYYVIEDPDGNHVDSCHGFIGESDYALEEGKSSLEWHIQQAKADKQRIAQAWASTKKGHA